MLSEIYNMAGIKISRLDRQLLRQFSQFKGRNQEMLCLLLLTRGDVAVVGRIK